jgi:hypothetical protein
MRIKNIVDDRARKIGKENLRILAHELDVLIENWNENALIR